MKNNNILMKYIQNKSFQCEGGYTLVETVVALALLVAVLIPAGHLLTKTIMFNRAGDLVIASQLAQREMERTIHSANYVSGENQVTLNSKKWRIVRQVTNEMGLIELQISVFKGMKAEAIFVLKTQRLGIREL